MTRAHWNSQVSSGDRAGLISGLYIRVHIFYAVLESRPRIIKLKYQYKNICNLLTLPPRCLLLARDNGTLGRLTKAGMSLKC
jgi:hypothetical protein